MGLETHIYQYQPIILPKVFELTSPASGSRVSTSSTCCRTAGLPYLCTTMALVATGMVGCCARVEKRAMACEVTDVTYYDCTD